MTTQKKKFVIQRHSPTGERDYLAEQSGYGGRPVYGYDTRTAFLYDTKEWAEMIVTQRCKKNRHHLPKSEGGYGLEKWKVVELSAEATKATQDFQRERQENQWYYRKREAEQILKGTPYQVVRKKE